MLAGSGKNVNLPSVLNKERKQKCRRRIVRRKPNSEVSMEPESYHTLPNDMMIDMSELFKTLW